MKLALSSFRTEHQPISCFYFKIRTLYFTFGFDLSKFSRASIFVMIFFYLSTEQLHITHETSRMALFTICEMTEIQPKEGLGVIKGMNKVFFTILKSFWKYT